MITTPTIPTLSSPQLLDAALLEIQTKLTDGLSWLDQAFGKAIRLEEMVDGRKRTYPAIYVKDNEYFPIGPDQHIGNFSFFDVEDGEGIEWSEYGSDKINARLALVLWFDYRDVYADPNNRSIENIKKDVKDVLKAMRLTRSHISFNRFWTNAEQVYKGYSRIYANPNLVGKERPALENRNYFWKRPFGCLRIEGEIIVKEKIC